MSLEQDQKANIKDIIRLQSILTEGTNTQGKNKVRQSQYRLGNHFLQESEESGTVENESLSSFTTEKSKK